MDSDYHPNQGVGVGVGVGVGLGVTDTMETDTMETEYVDDTGYAEDRVEGLTQCESGPNGPLSRPNGPLSRPTGPLSRPNGPPSSFTMSFAILLHGI